MAKQTKRQKALPQVDSTKLYPLENALAIVKGKADLLVEWRIERAA